MYVGVTDQTGHILLHNERAARKIAAQSGVDLKLVSGTGPGGRILKANVEEFRRKSDVAQTSKPAPAAVTTRPTPVPGRGSPEAARPSS